MPFFGNGDAKISIRTPKIALQIRSASFTVSRPYVPASAEEKGMNRMGAS